MDLAHLDNSDILDAGIDVPILHPTTHQPIGLTFRLTSFEGDVVKRERRKIENDRLRTSGVVTAEETEAQVLRMRVAAVLGWTFDEGVTLDGEQPEWNRGNVERIFRRFPFVAEQVDAAAGNRALFFQAEQD